MEGNNKFIISRRKLLAGMAAMGLSFMSGGVINRLSDKSSNTGVSVRDYGAAGNGVKDDTAAFQKAINDCVAKGYKLYVPAGKYLIKGTLDNFDNLIMEGVSNNKSYWSQTDYDDFEKGSVLHGSGDNVLIGGSIKRAQFSNLCFENFDLVAGVSSPRYVLFDSCSFKEIRRVLSAPGNKKGAYHNYKFRYCSFTVYDTDVLFEGRIIDSSWDQCVFVGTKPFDWVQAIANQVTNCRFEWIDRDAAISMYACRMIQISNNFFDRVRGAAIEIKQKNSGIVISANQFNRCGSGKNSAGDGTNMKELYKSFVVVYGDFSDVNIIQNTFLKSQSNDRSGELCPQYVIAKRAAIPNCQFKFQGNVVVNGFVSSLIFDEDQTYENIKIDVDYVFPSLADYVVNLAQCASHEIQTSCDTDTIVEEIPAQLTVRNKANIQIAGEQKGAVFGGKVNGFMRYDRGEVIFEDYAYHKIVSLSMDWNKSYDIPLSHMVKGVYLHLSILYSTSGNPDGGVTVSMSGSSTLSLPKLPLSGFEKKLYTAKFYIPFQSSSDSARIYVFSDGSSNGTGSIFIHALSATYTSFTPKQMYDLMS
ncbi:glycosyl hydrolase family 28-related protein [Paenibacillus sp. LHD-38]|uniref:glycosyl hydrolase family 28-related protein n=1 Tax=Paenibacillus sp. LHD-38 TaxID=3072143 RepID=UPI0028108B9E|nr:glycosyl hydrolase family 28-related protein [Paenibacillus sp. LHD-38]MDQ8737011.1 glycosyl hydrolase family 28-related protein [Paenibacillus sp. LHD-38]